MTRRPDETAICRHCGEPILRNRFGWCHGPLSGARPDDACDTPEPPDGWCPQCWEAPCRCAELDVDLDELVISPCVAHDDLGEPVGRASRPPASPPSPEASAPRGPLNLLAERRGLVEAVDLTLADLEVGQEPDEEAPFDVVPAAARPGAMTDRGYEVRYGDQVMDSAPTWLLAQDRVEQLRQAFAAGRDAERRRVRPAIEALRSARSRFGARSCASFTGWRTPMEEMMCMPCCSDRARWDFGAPPRPGGGMRPPAGTSGPTERKGEGTAGDRAAPGADAADGDCGPASDRRAVPPRAGDPGPGAREGRESGEGAG